jgi:hypothetical protein
VAQGHGSVAPQQKQGERQADDVAAPDDDGAASLDREGEAVEELDASERGAGGKERVRAFERSEGADVVRVEAVDVLSWGDGLDDRLGVDVLGELVLLGFLFCFFAVFFCLAGARGGGLVGGAARE